VGEDQEKQDNGPKYEDGVECDTCGTLCKSDRGLSYHRTHAHNDKTEKIECECDQCGSTFEKDPYQYEQSEKHYCSIECMGEKWKGASNPRWRGGYEDEYGSRWRQIRLEIIERDDEKCQRCGMERDEHYELTGCDLEVHHKKPLRTFDGDLEEANNPSNLITYCRECHMKVEHQS
jgi:hypothetical protein